MQKKLSTTQLKKVALHLELPDIANEITNMDPSAKQTDARVEVTITT